MDLLKFTSTWRATASENKFLRMTCGGLLVANLALVGAVTLRGTETILVPPSITEKMTVAQNSIDPAGKKQWAAYLAALVGNVTPGNVGYTIEQLQSMLAPQLWSKLRQNLADQVERVKRDNITLSFEAKQLTYERETDKVFVVGRSILRTTSGAEQRTDRVFEIQLHLEAGLPTVTALDAYDGEAHTQFWQQRQQQREDAAAQTKREARAAARDSQ